MPNKSERLLQEVHQQMIENNLTLAVAESCTGGMVQQLLTSIPNASSYFEGGMVLYSNKAKTNVLGVEKETVDRDGAVSRDTASEMAFKIRNKFNTAIGISVTGIAGPAGGNADKPIGTVFFAISSNEYSETFHKQFIGDRANIREQSTMFILEILLNYFTRVKSNV